MVPAIGDVYLSIATRSRHLIVLAGKTKLYVMVITREPIVFEVGSTSPRVGQGGILLNCHGRNHSTVAVCNSPETMREICCFPSSLPSTTTT